MSFVWDGSFVSPTSFVYPVQPIKTGQCASYEAISSGPHIIYVNIHISQYGCSLGPCNEFFLRDNYMPGVDIELALDL